MENKNNKKDMTVNELSVLMLKSFDLAQKHVNERFENFSGEMNKNFGEVKKQIDTININTTDVIRQEEFDKLENRVVDVEDVLKLKLKKA